MTDLFPEITADVTVSGKAVRRLRQGHLWIYASDVLRDVQEEDPAIVRVLDGHGNVIGYAFHSPRSKIRLRLLSREDEPPSRDFFARRVGAAVERRRNLIAPGSACRLVFGESDLLPSVLVDRYDEYLVLQTLSRGADKLKPLLVDILREVLDPRAIVERNDVKARTLEGLDQSRGALYGEIPPLVEITEADVRFLVDLMGGQKTGFFLDQRENRVAAREYARGRALDCFTNTGAFALHLARNCERVMAVDLSEDSLRQAERNAAANSGANVEFVKANVFDWLRELERAGEIFETVCLDPPAFARNRRALAGARAGYKEINLRAMKLLKTEGILITSSCSHHLSEADFFLLLHEASGDVHRHLQVLERRSQARDHPVLSGMPETHYLKCFILRVI